MTEHGAPADCESRAVSTAIAIRLAGVADAAAISALISRLTREYVLPDQPEPAAETLRAWMAPDAVAARIAAGHRHHLAEIGSALAGVVATRDNAHMHLLFVDTPFQRRGLARTLWQSALAACVEAARPERITVNASAFAVPMYLRLGFEVVQPERSENDIVSTPMVFRVSGRGTG
ncbi:GNAT family N-acetyltransferase [Dokdonella soli]|uniref:N-acetyltransferase domain-containing protein n=1 Tax=Dokdonella soli TaxID=529810 RepID=A0ABN1IW05_9GAMM